MEDDGEPWFGIKFTAVLIALLIIWVIAWNWLPIPIQ